MLPLILIVYQAPCRASNCFLRNPLTTKSAGDSVIIRRYTTLQNLSSLLQPPYLWSAPFPCHLAELLKNVSKED